MPTAPFLDEDDSASSNESCGSGDEMDSIFSGKKRKILKHASDEGISLLSFVFLEIFAFHDPNSNLFFNTRNAPVSVGLISLTFECLGRAPKKSRKEKEISTSREDKRMC